MLLSADLAAAYLDNAWEEVLDVLGRVEDDELNVKPFGASTNSIAALVAHSAGVCEFWLGHVGLGEASERDRDAEFRHESDRRGLEELIAGQRAVVPGRLRRLAAGEGSPSEIRSMLLGDQSDDSIVLHVLEELYQHLGHLDLTVDALLARRTT